MRTFSLLKILNNDYLKLIFFLILCYVLSHTTFKVLSKVDYIIVVYAFYIGKLTEDNIIQYSAIFGLFYDYHLDSLLGINVLFFLAISLLHLRYYTTFKSTNVFVGFASIAVTILVFVIYNAIYVGFPFSSSIFAIIVNFLIDVLLYLFCYFILELIRAIPIFKR